MFQMGDKMCDVSRDMNIYDVLYAMEPCSLGEKVAGIAQSWTRPLGVCDLPKTAGS